MADVRVLYEVSLGDDGTPRLITSTRKVADETGKADDQHRRWAGTMQTAVGTAVGFLAAQALPRLGAAIGNTIERTSKLNSLETAFDSLSASIGLQADTMRTELRGATQGLISDFDLIEKTNNALTLGIVESQKQWTELTGAGVKLGRAVGLNATQAIESLTIGLGRQSKLVLDNLGIIVNSEGAYKRYAEQLGKTQTELTESERKSAFLAEAQRAILAAAERAGDAQLVLGDRIQQARVRLTNWIDGLIRALNQSQPMQQALERLSEAFGGAGGALDTITAGFVSALPWIARAIELIASLVEIATALPSPVLASAAAFLGAKGLIAGANLATSAIGGGAGLTAAISGPVGLTVALVALASQLPVTQTLLEDMADAARKIAEDFGLMSREVTGSVDASVADHESLLSIFERTGPVLTVVRRAVRETYDEFERRLREEHAEKLRKALEDLNLVTFGSLDSEVKALGLVIDSGQAPTEQLAKAIDDLFKRAGDLGLLTPELTRTLVSYKRKVGETEDPVRQLTDAMNALSNSVLENRFQFEDLSKVDVDWPKLLPPPQAPALIDTLERSMERYGVKLPDVNREIAQLNLMWQSGQVPARQMAEIVARQHEELKKLGVLTPETNALLQEMADKTSEAAGGTSLWQEALVGVFDVIRTGRQWLDNLISSVTSFIGSLLSGQGPLASFQSSLAGIGGLLGSFGGTGGGILGNVLGALGSGGPLAGLLGGGGAAAAAATTAAGVAGVSAEFAAPLLPSFVPALPGGAAAATGAGGLGGLTSSLGGLLTNPLTGVVAGGALGAFGLFKLLTKSREEARTERQAGIFGDLGGISQGTAKFLADLSIQATKANRQLPDTIASIKGLGTVLQETGIRSEAAFVFAFSKAREGIERFQQGHLRLQEVNQALAESFPFLQEAAQRFGGASADQLQQLIDLAQAAGLSIGDEMAKAVRTVAGASEQAAATATSTTHREIDKLRRVAKSQLDDLGREIQGARGRQRIEIEAAIEHLQIQIAEWNRRAADAMQNAVDSSAIAGRSIGNNLTVGLNGGIQGPVRTTTGAMGHQTQTVEIRSDRLSRLADALEETLEVRNDRRRVASREI